MLASSDVTLGQTVSPSDAWQRFWEAALTVVTVQLEQLQEITSAALFPASEPLLRAQIPLITVTTMGTVYFWFGVYMHVLGLPLASVSSVAFHIPLYMSLLSYHKVVVTDPGHIPSNWKSQADVIANHHLKLRVQSCTTERKRKEPSELRYCRKEGTYKPDRAHYCKEAHRNVLRMDHWTPWLRTCVGFYNHKFFILFLLYSSIASNLAWTHLGWALMAKSISGTRVFMLANGSIISFFVAALTTPYLGFQCFLLGVNSTSLEYWEKRWDGPWMPSPYDHGFTSNVSSVMGHPALWLVPCGTPPTAGTEFVVAQRSSNPRRRDPFVKIQDMAEVSHKLRAAESVRVARGGATALAASAAVRRSRELPSAVGEQASFLASVRAGAQKPPSSQDFITFTGLITPAAATGPATDPKGSSNFQKHPSREASFITYWKPSAVAPPGQARSSPQNSFRLLGEGSPFSAQKQRRSSAGAMAIGAASTNLKSPMSRHSLSGTSTTRRVGFATLLQNGKQEAPRRRDSTKMIRAGDPAPARADEANWRARPTDAASEISSVSSPAEPVWADEFLSSNSPISRAKARQARPVRLASEGGPALVSQAAVAPGGNVAASRTLPDVTACSSTAASSAAPAARTSDDSVAQAGSLPQASGAADPLAEELDSFDAVPINAEENPYEDMDGPFCYGNFFTSNRRGKVTTKRWADMEEEDEHFGEEDTSFISCGWENVFEKIALDDNMSYPSASDAPYHPHAQAIRRNPDPDSETD